MTTLPLESSRLRWYASINSAVAAVFAVYCSHTALSIAQEVLAGASLAASAAGWTLQAVARWRRPAKPARLHVGLPGAALDRCAEFLASPELYRLTFQPMVAEMQAEYFATLAAGRPWKASWVVFRWRISFLRSVLECMLQAVRDLWQPFD